MNIPDKNGSDGETFTKLSVILSPSLLVKTDSHDRVTLNTHNIALNKEKYCIILLILKKTPNIDLFRHAQTLLDD